MRSLFSFFCVLPWAVFSHAQPAHPALQALQPAQAQALVDQALATELRAAQDTSHPMRYLLSKQSPRLSTIKEILETRDGAVARLVAMNGQPLSPAGVQKEQQRLQALYRDPGRQRHRKQSEDADTQRALDVLRVLPQAFVYEYMGAAEGPAGRVEKFIFRPNPAFDPPDLETQVLKAMNGQIWIDGRQQRVVRLEGRLQQDVDFGWGLLGRLNKGGWIVLEQADVGGHQWRLVHFQMQMRGRVLFKTKVFDTTEEESQFAPLPVGLTYRQAIEMLWAEPRGGQ